MFPQFSDVLSQERDAVCVNGKGVGYFGLSIDSTLLA